MSHSLPHLHPNISHKQLFMPLSLPNLHQHFIQTTHWWLYFYLLPPQHLLQTTIDVSFIAPPPLQYLTQTTHWCFIFPHFQPNASHKQALMSHSLPLPHLNTSLKPSLMPHTLLTSTPAPPINSPLRHHPLRCRLVRPVSSASQRTRNLFHDQRLTSKLWRGPV